MKEKDILKRLVKNDALFRNIHVITQNYDIIPKDKNHMGAYICLLYTSDAADE